LADELRAWAEEGRSPRLWLRDDDVTEPTPALDRYLALLNRHAVPAVLAAIPAVATPALAERLAHEPRIAIAQHGFAHRNHAPAGEKKCELGDHRPSETVLDELRRGRARLKALFGPRAIDLLVPPWNRISPTIAKRCVGTIAAAISVYGQGLAGVTVPVINTHVDLIDWRGGRVCRPLPELAEGLTAALAASRRGAGAPVGLLTHHLDHDAAADAFLDALFATTGPAPWLTGPDVLAYSTISRSS
jgi:peptidoglycan/xylan/chitin deacetylase (PgdA/CDA1 family)